MKRSHTLNQLLSWNIMANEMAYAISCEAHYFVLVMEIDTSLSHPFCDIDDATLKSITRVCVSRLSKYFSQSSEVRFQGKEEDESMALSAEQKSLRLVKAGNELRSSSSLQTEELLLCLDDVECLLSGIEQTPTPSLLSALLPSMSALIRPELMTHHDMGVKASVFSCLMEITRISAPEPPFSDEKIKEIFELGIEVLDGLSLSEGRAYQKAVSALTVIAKVKAAILLLNLGGEALILQIFCLLLKHVRSDHLQDVFPSMAAIMTQVVEESDEIPSDLLSLLLSSVRREKQETSPMSLRLGETVIKGCGDKLQGCVGDSVRKGDINLRDYTEVVSSINDRADFGRGIFIMDSELPGSSHSSEGRDGVASREKMGNFEIGEPDCVEGAQPVSSPPLIDPKRSDPSRSGRAGDSLPPKRGRKPNSLMNPEEGYESPLTSFIKSGSRSIRQGKLATSSKQPKKCSQKRKASELGHDDETQKKTPKSLVIKLKNKETASESAGKVERNDTEKQKLASIEAGYALVGKRINVLWPLDKVFYEGTVKSYDPDKKKHHVQYDDGDKEVLNLNKQQWELCESKPLESEDQKAKRNPEKQVKEETSEFSPEEWDSRRTSSARGKQSKKKLNQAKEPKSVQSRRSQPKISRDVKSSAGKKVKTLTEPKQEKADYSERYPENEINPKMLDREKTGSSLEAERIEMPAVKPDDESQQKRIETAKIKKLTLSFSGLKKKSAGK